MKGIHGRQLRVLLISGKHRGKAIGGGEHDFGKIRAVGASHLRREDVFEFVREFAEFVKPASRRIALKRVHNAANAANDFLVGRTRLEFQPGFVEPLQQFRGAFKEESAQLVVAIVGLAAHVAASIR